MSQNLEPHLVDLQQRILQLTETKESIAQSLSETQKELDDCKLKMISALRAVGLNSFKSDFGIVTITPKFNVRLPSSAADWDKLYGYLKEIGEYDGLRSINSQRLNAWYKTKLNEQTLAGNIDWCPPGLEEPTAIETLSIRKVHNI